MKNDKIYGITYDGIHTDISRSLKETKRYAIEGGYNIISVRYDSGYHVSIVLYLWGTKWVENINEVISEEAGYVVDFLYIDCDIPFYELHEISRTINALYYHYNNFFDIEKHVFNNLSEKLYIMACKHGDGYYIDNKSNFDNDLSKYLELDFG